MSGIPALTEAYEKLNAQAKVHRLKISYQYFRAVQSGAKRFEVRKDDRGFFPGDTVILECRGTDEECNPQTLEFRIGYVLYGGQFGIEPGYCVFQLEPAA